MRETATISVKIICYDRHIGIILSTVRVTSLNFATKSLHGNKTGVDSDVYSPSWRLYIANEAI